jgi:hypothetical protein
MKIDSGKDSTARCMADAVGIVVQNGAHAARPPRAVAFVWGGKVRPRPSLPFGRWKAKGIRTAA